MEFLFGVHSDFSDFDANEEWISVEGNPWPEGHRRSTKMLAATGNDGSYFSSSLSTLQAIKERKLLF